MERMSRVPFSCGILRRHAGASAHRRPADKFQAGCSFAVKFTGGCRFVNPVVKLSEYFLCFQAELWQMPEEQDAILIN